MSGASELPTLEDVVEAAARLHGVAHRTPVLTSRTLDERVGAFVFAKAECFQRIGAFKFRGAFNAVAALSSEMRSSGVLSYSSGNHAQAMALAASLHDVPAVIVMPEDAPALKIEATRAYGAEVVFYDRYRQDRNAIALTLAEERAMVLIPPFNHWDVIAGQGTAALELFDEVVELDTLLVPVGGGGLISGCSIVAKSQHTPPRVVGVEPEAGDDVRQSLRLGKIVSIKTPTTIADGQQTTAAGAKTFAVMSRLVDEIVVVSDDEIVGAMRFAFERMKVVLEPSGASALAALMAGRIGVKGQRVGVILSGGNIDSTRFGQLVGS